MNFGRYVCIMPCQHECRLFTSASPALHTHTAERDSSHDWTGRGGINFLSLRAGRPTAAEHSKESKRGRPPIVACRPRVEGTSRVRSGDGFWNASYSARVAVDIVSSRTLQGTSFGGERPLCRTIPRRLCKVHGSIPMSGVQHCAHDETTYRMSIYQDGGCGPARPHTVG